MRFFRALLALYPTRFREEYGDELCRAFAERMCGRSRLVTALAAVADVVPNAVAAHWDILRLDAAAGTTIPAFGSDVRFALRQIARTPLLSSVIIGVVAVGIGINAGLLTILDTFAWSPAPGIPADRSLVRLSPRVWYEAGHRFRETSLSYPDLDDLRTQRDVFADIAAWTSSQVSVDLGGGAQSRIARYATANYFRTLRIRLAAGTGFPAGELDPVNAGIAVISHADWISDFGGAADVVGRTIRIMNVPFTVVGVAPPMFTGVDVTSLGQPTIWLPLAARSLLEPGSESELGHRDALIFRSVARLSSGLRAHDVEGRARALSTRLAGEHRATHPRLAIRAEPLTGVARDKADRRELVAAFGLVASLILVITCTNVSVLLIGRAAARRREIGVRLALGATRLRIARQMLTESLVHALAGALLGLALYVPIVRIAFATVPDVAYFLTPQPATLLYATLFVFITTVAFGLAPALHATGADIGEVMKNSGNHAIRRSRLQRLFVIIQLASSQPVLVVTSLVLADIRHEANQQADLAPSSVVTMSSTLRHPQAAADPSRGPVDARAFAATSTLEAMRLRLALIPGVQSVAISTDGVDPTPIVRMGGPAEFSVAGKDATAAMTHLHQLYVSQDYFATYGRPVARGRPIGTEENRPGATAVVVNRSAADLLWPGEDAVGKRLVRRDGGPDGTSAVLDVIGVADPAPYERQSVEPTVYAPLATAPSGWSSTIAVRTTGNARPSMPLIRSAIGDIDAYTAIDQVSTLAEQYESERREAILANLAAFVVAAAALVLASIGLYAIIACAVTQRTREIGVRLAIGATRGRVVGDFFRSGLVAAGIGLAIGLPLTVVGIRLVQASLLGFTLQSLAAVFLVVPALIGVAALASWLPARRAGRVDPMIALRTE